MPEIEDLTNRHLVKIAGNIRSKLLQRRLDCCREVQLRIDRVVASMDQLQSIRKKLGVCVSRKWFAAAEKVLGEAMDRRDSSGLTLRQLLRGFFEFLTVRCGEQDRANYIEAVNSMQTGTHFGRDVESAYDSDELQDEKPERLIPNVRLVNGATRAETRQRLMRTFNTPFYPDVLVASSVMAEGVDLHLNCRHVIHHDLCWNPSTLEQRTGRIDRIGAKAEQCCQPIYVYLPYIGETQDEKMYRVVMDRERWFKVVMGEKYQVDARTTERLAERVPLPESAAADLTFHLEVVQEGDRFAKAKGAIDER